MSVTLLEQIEANITRLSFSDQLLLMERLAHRLRRQTLPVRPSLAAQLAMMANDPEIQRELQLIEAEFAGTEADGLDVE
jgi:hypothetical protein